MLRPVLGVSNDEGVPIQSFNVNVVDVVVVGVCHRPQPTLVSAVGAFLVPVSSMLPMISAAARSLSSRTRGVNPKRHRRISVTQTTGNGPNINSGTDELCRGEVTEVVKSQ